MSAFYSTGPLPDPHENCEPKWQCWTCPRLVCPRCDPSPGEFTQCSECFDFIGGPAA